MTDLNKIKNDEAPPSKEEVVETVKTKKRGSATSSVGSMIRYQWISANVPFFLFLAALAVLYIANGHMADKTIRDINSTAKQLKELQYEYKTLKSEMMFKSRETEMIKAAEPLGLKITNEPPVHIALESTKKN